MANDKHVKLLIQGVSEWNKNRPDEPDLSGVDLRGADLHFANLRGVNLHFVNLHGANLYGANLRGIIVNWQSHDLIAEILLQTAGDDIEKLKVAWFILISHKLCWGEFLALNDPLADWALTELAKWHKKGDRAPKKIAERT